MRAIEPLILLYKGKSLTSRLIKWQSRGEYSHAAILFGDKVYESREFSGVSCRDIEAIDAAADCYVLSEHGVYLLPGGQSERWLQEQCGKKYDYAMVLDFVLRRRKQESRRSSNKWFCSELAFMFFDEKLGIKLLNTDACMVSPHLLSLSPLIKKIRNPIH